MGLNRPTGIRPLPLMRRLMLATLLATIVFAEEPAPTSALTFQTVESRALVGNRLGDSPNRSVVVYLPPSYLTSPDRRYPSIYLLHGYNNTNTSWVEGGYQGFRIQADMDRLIVAGDVREMIVVMPDGRNSYGGSYYTNSPVTGNWEDFLTQDLVSYVDLHYRTVPRSASRGIVGWSMGGYGAIYLAMKHPETYSAVYGLSACCLDFVGDIDGENPEWVTTLRLSRREDLGVLPQSGKNWRGNYPNAFIGLGAALSPNPDKPPFFVDLPFELSDGRPRRVETIYRKWLANFPAAMVPLYRSNLQKLRGIQFVIGKSDHLAHIPLGNRALAKALSEHGLRYVYEEDEGDHGSRLREWMEMKVLPFFSHTLAFEPQRQ